jgi:NAD(P)-dependent dehydrogenase (short-subunit alcohol dehydrogenase family)
MDIAGRVAVVTGGSSGIGRAIAVALAAAGARVVVGDIDEAGANATAALAGDAVGVRADAGDQAGIAAMVGVAERRFGPVDIYVANAGIIGASGLGDERDWDRIIDLNLRGHVRAANLLVPQWQSRGSGYFVSVASAAGLLTQLGAAGYAVTKHAAVGFAEWLAVTYGDDGIGVSCVCPLGVETPLLDAVRSGTNSDERIGAASIVTSGDVISPDDVAAAVVEAVGTDRFLVLPHPQVLEMYRHKGADYGRWIAGMRRLQRSLRAR